MAQSGIVKPDEYQPLTSLPWQAPHATLEGALKAIYREPDPTIRYPVLACYLWTMPAGELGKAFDICVPLEGVQRPDDFIYRFLEIWGARDPEACWTKTRQLFRLVMYDQEGSDWLDCTTWTTRMVVPDVDAIRASPYWIGPPALKGFPLGVGQSGVADKDRVKIMRAFADQWFDAFGTWPGNPTSGAVEENPAISNNPDYIYSDPRLIDAFLTPVDQLTEFASSEVYPGQKAVLDIAERRQLKAAPGSAAEIIKSLEAALQENGPKGELSPSMGTLMLWASLDKAGMVRWADEHGGKGARFDARAVLMSRVDDATRARWLAETRTPNPDDDLTSQLLIGWGGWDPGAALHAAMTSATDKNAIFGSVFDEIEDGPFRGASVSQDWVHFELEGIRNFALEKAQEKLWVGSDDHFEELMEDWGDIDIGEDARFGMNLMKRAAYPDREAMLRYFSGEDVEGEETGVVERTMAALRVWAVVRPREMKAWIGTLDDPALQKALTWMLNNPLGGKTGSK